MNQTKIKALAEQLQTPRYPKSDRVFGLRMTTVRNGAHMRVYSVLGVMADIYIRAKGPGAPHWEESGELDKCDRFIVNTLHAIEEPWVMDIPNVVIDWYELTREETNRIMISQMRGFSFEQIGQGLLKLIRKVA